MTILRRFLGVLFGLGFLLLPLAFASASVSVSLQSLSPSTSISVGTTISFTVSASGFTDPITYSVSDSLGGGSISNSNINSSGNFSWTPNQNDIGTHTLTITVSDSAGNSTPLQEQITVSAAPAISIQSLSPSSSINIGQTVSFTVTPSGFTNPSYSLSDSLNGSTVSNSNINSSGNFSWTPATQDVGSHNITVTVIDTAGHNSTASESLVVNSVAAVVIQSLSPSSTVNPRQNVSFTAAASGFSNPTFSLNDSFSGSTIANSNINSSGNVSWTPTTTDIGTHTITIWANDTSSHSASVAQQIVVQNATSTSASVTIALTAPSPSSTIATGATVVFTAFAYGFTTPTYTLTDSFSSTSISNGNINASGGFAWTPTAHDSGVHTIIVTATDSYSHSASANAQITIVATTSASTTSTSADALMAQLHALQAKLAELLHAPKGASTTSYKFLKPLKVGSTGIDVTELQKRLTLEGVYSGPVTGRFGSLTQAAVKKYQAKHGITQLGNVGPATRAALNGG